MPNEYQAIWEEESNDVSSFTTRHRMVEKFAWAIPNDKALQRIAEWSPLVDMGAGTGYWANLLTKLGATVLAYDIEPPNLVQNDYHHRNTVWHPVMIGDTRMLSTISVRYTLMLCWPPFDLPMAYDALRHYLGDRLIYIGESAGGCTGDEKFHTQLYERWEQVEEVVIPRWFGMHDYCGFYTRK